MITILHVLSSPRAEGTPRIVLDWLSQTEIDLKQELLFIHPEGELASSFQSRTEWQYYNTDFRLGVRSFPKLILLVKKIVRQRKPDIVICWNTGISAWVAIGAKLGGKVRVISHAGNYPGARWNFHAMLHTNITAYIHFLTRSKIICCSEYIKISYQQVKFTPASVFYAVYNCISINSFSAGKSWSERKIDAIMVATLEKHKDHDTLLHAWKILEQKGLPYSLILVGSGSQKQILEEKAIALGINGVRFLGSRNDVNELFSNSRIFVFSTTIEEGFGTVLLEALASGCEIIASDVPACREVLKNGSFGILVQKKSPHDLAKAIEMRLKDGEYHDRILAKEYLQGFSTTNMISQYLEISKRAV